MHCDLHAHSTASDGVHRPAELVRLAAQAGIETLALTDHDTTAGLPEAAEACAQWGIDFVPGIEVSADPWLGDGEPAAAARFGTLHILGLFVSSDDEALAQVERSAREARGNRNERIVAGLNRLGLALEPQEPQEQAERSGSRVVGRPHIARAMMARGYVASVGEAFGRYLGEGKAAYARADTLPAQEAIEAIHHAGGLAILAHPIQLKRSHHDLIRYVQQLADRGLDGVEVWHSAHRPEDCRRYHELADRLHLLISGGSDYHGHSAWPRLGEPCLSARYHDRLRAAADRRGASV